MREIYSPYFVDEKTYSRDPEMWEVFVNKTSHLEGRAREIFFSSDTPCFLEMLCLNSSLSEQQSAELSRIVRDIFLGDLFIGDMPTTIIQKLNLDQQTAQQIQNKIMKDLFAPAIEDIKKIQREKFPDRIGQGSANTMPQPPTPLVNQSNVIDLRNQQ